MFYVLLSIFLAPFWSALLVGCSIEPSPYQAYGPNKNARYGYSGFIDVPLQRNTYKVSYTSSDSNEVRENYLFKRCAELTLQHGYRYFIILDPKGNTDRFMYTDPTAQSLTSDQSYGVLRGKTIQITSYDSYTHKTLYTQIVVIKLLTSNKSAPSSFDAWAIFQTLKEKEAREAKEKEIQAMQSAKSALWFNAINTFIRR